MRIKALRIKGYRSFEDSGDIGFSDLQWPISIIGYNGAGKTNFVRAIRHAMCNLYSFERSFSRSDFYMGKDGAIDVKVELDQAPVSDPGAFGQFKEMPVIKLVVSQQNGVITDVKHNFYDKDEKAIYIPQASRVASDRLKTLTDDQREAVQSLYKSGSQTVYRNKDKVPFYYVDFSTIVAELASPKDSLLSKKMYELVHTFEADTNVMTHGDKYKGQPRKDIYKKFIDYLDHHVLTSPEIEDFLSQFKDLLAQDLELNGDVFNAQFQNPDYAKVLRSVQFNISDGDGVPALPIDQLGSGMAALAAMTLLQILLGVEGGGKIIIIEEPETYLHEHYQAFFYKVLARLSKKNQVIITTHSKNFIDIFKPESILRIKKDAARSIVIAGKQLEPLDGALDTASPLSSVDDFGRYMRTIEPNINSVLFAKKVVIVEGPHVSP